MAPSTRALWRIGGTVGTGQFLSYGLIFGRNVIVARALGPEEYGRAATLLLTVSLFEMLSNLAVDRMIVQDKDGGDGRFLATAHLVQFVRGAALAAAALILAGPVASLFGDGGSLWAFQWLALVPLIRGVAHLGTIQAQRTLGFSRAIQVDIVGQAVATAAAAPLAYSLQNFSVVLWLLLLQVAAAALASHVIARQRYRWSFERTYCKRILTFGFPLLLDSMLLFAIFQGDRLIIAGAYDSHALGIYSIAFGLTMLPTMMMAKVGGLALLPILSREREAGPRFNQKLGFVLQSYSVAAVVVAIAFVLVGGQLIVSVYGEGYAAAGRFVGWLAAMQAVQLIHTGTTLASIAQGDTWNSFVSSIVRLSGVILAILAALGGLDLVWIAIAGFAGELCRYFASAFWLRRYHTIGYGITLKPLVFCLITVATASVAELSSFAVQKPTHVALLLVGLLMATIVVAGWLYPRFWRRWAELALVNPASSRA